MSPALVPYHADRSNSLTTLPQPRRPACYQLPWLRSCVYEHLSPDCSSQRPRGPTLSGTDVFMPSSHATPAPIFIPKDSLHFQSHLAQYFLPTLFKEVWKAPDWGFSIDMPSSSLIAPSANQAFSRAQQRHSSLLLQCFYF